MLPWTHVLARSMIRATHIRISTRVDGSASESVASVAHIALARVLSSIWPVAAQSILVTVMCAVHTLVDEETVLSVAAISNIA